MTECKEDYFKEIDTEDKAYWLGFIYADGCITQNKRSLILCLSPIDYEHLNKFNNDICSNAIIKHRDDGRYIWLQINNVNFVKHLIDKGCMPAKTLILKYPSENQVPKILMRHFIRGNFDGDGCIYAKYRHHKGKKQLFMHTELNFLGTQDFLNGVNHYLPIEDIAIKKKGTDNVFTMRIYSKKTIITVMDYLYDDALTFLSRKRDKYMNNIKQFNLKDVRLLEASIS